MKLCLALLLPIVLMACTAKPPGPTEPTVTSLMSKVLADVPGKEGLVLLVEYGPGGADPIHRHNAHAFVYVLEGSVVMQVKGSEQVILSPGQMFYEAPQDVHLIGRNASSTEPAKFVVFLVKDAGAPAFIPEHGPAH